MAEVSKIYFHFPDKVEESLELELSFPAPLVGEVDNENELHLCLDEETFDKLYSTYKDYNNKLKEELANAEVEQG